MTDDLHPEGFFNATILEHWIDENYIAIGFNIGSNRVDGRFYLDTDKRPGDKQTSFARTMELLSPYVDDWASFDPDGDSLVGKACRVSVNHREAASGAIYAKVCWFGVSKRKPASPSLVESMRQAIRANQMGPSTAGTSEGIANYQANDARGMSGADEMPF